MKLRRPWALPLVPFYRAGLALDGALRSRQRSLLRPVVSVGSLSAGGAGKTPVVRALATLLARHGLAADVLTRGYGRRSTAVARVDPQGTAESFGDEPLELARAGLAVYVGGGRYLAGLEAERAGSAGVHLLDDGFQHRQLARALDIVLLTREDVEDTLLPAGNLREPLSALARAHVVLVRAEEAEALAPVVAARSAAAIWTSRRWLELPRQLPSRPFAFCALARPHSFFNMLVAAGCRLAGRRAFADHAFYGTAELQALLHDAQAACANGFLTTAKDAVKLSPQALACLGAVGPVQVAGLTVAFEDEAAIAARLHAIARPARVRR